MYFYIIILKASELTNNKLCCKYGMTTQNYKKYFSTSRYNGYNKIISQIIVLEVRDGKNEENKFRNYLEFIQTIFPVEFHGDTRNEFFDIIGFDINKLYKYKGLFNKFTKEYLYYSRNYDNNIIE